MILRPDREHADALVIDSWVMSCRVFGRQLEFEAMNIAVETARFRGARTFYADYIPTKKNDVIVDLYPSLGFTRVKSDSTGEGATRWFLDLAEFVARQTHIDRSEGAT
jgi:predicted enzyme involved in methoxymalonyl-ACP biosynthesis